MILVLLQNAYSRSRRAAKLVAKDRELWLSMLERTRTGGRLKLLLGERCFVDGRHYFANATPRVGVGADSCLRPCVRHVERLIAGVSPRLIVTCGSNAARIASCLWHGPLVAVPHPACRVLTNGLYAEARKTISRIRSGRVVFRQGKANIARQKLPCASGDFSLVLSA